MAKRSYTARAICGHEGCREVALFSAESRKEQRDIEIRYSAGKWRCVRHSRPDEVLSSVNLITKADLVATKSDSPMLKDKLYWNGSNGFAHGNGYKAFAKDFPEGTILRVTAEIILPEGGS